MSTIDVHCRVYKSDLSNSNCHALDYDHALCPLNFIIVHNFTKLITCVGMVLFWLRYAIMLYIFHLSHIEKIGWGHVCLAHVYYYMPIVYITLIMYSISIINYLPMHFILAKSLHSNLHC